MTSDEKRPVLVHAARAHKREDLPEFEDGYCPICKRPLETGFGLAGGGYGVYTYCEEHGVTSKTEVNE